MGYGNPNIIWDLLLIFYSPHAIIRKKNITRAKAKILTFLYLQVDPKRVSKKAQHGKIFVGGLTPEITDEDIKNYFGQYGTIVEVQAPFDKTKNQRRSYCFVTFDSKEVVYKLLKTPKQTINGKEIDVKKVKVNQEQRQGFWGPQYGGYGYGGGNKIPFNNYNNYNNYYRPTMY